jgi:hypothetical protein
MTLHDVTLIDFDGDPASGLHVLDRPWAVMQAGRWVRAPDV